MTAATINEQLASEGLVKGTPEWDARAMEILAGPREARRLKRLSARQLESELSSAAAALGRIRSPAKAAAARANGRLSKGRPRVPRCPECQRRETEQHRASCPRRT